MKKVINTSITLIYVEIIVIDKSPHPISTIVEYSISVLVLKLR